VLSLSGNISAFISGNTGISVFSSSGRYTVVWLTEKLGLQGTVMGIIIGSTFDWKDIFCYALGCIAFAVAERLLNKK